MPDRFHMNPEDTHEVSGSADEKIARESVATFNPNAREHEYGPKAAASQRIGGGIDGADVRPGGPQQPRHVLRDGVMVVVDASEKEEGE